MDTYGITFPMLWSDTTDPTRYYYSYTGTWSGFWLLDSTGRRLVPGHFRPALVEFLLGFLF